MAETANDPLSVAFRAILMAKYPAPGRVKTRLAQRIGQVAAAQVHDLFTQCTIKQVMDNHLQWTQRLLAWDRPWEAWAAGVDRVLEQGTGDLGERMDRVWRETGADEAGGVFFFGCDVPDLPVEAVAEAMVRLRGGAYDVALGPAEDGGYWTMGAMRYEPGLLSGIDWGTANVYDQTCRAAARLGLRVWVMPRWRDVDEPQDLVALYDRLMGAQDPSLVALREQLGPMVALI